MIREFPENFYVPGLTRLIVFFSGNSGKNAVLFVTGNFQKFSNPEFSMESG